MLHGAWSVCLGVGHTGELCKHGWTDRDAVWGLTHVGPRNHVLDGGVKIVIYSQPLGVTNRRCGLLPNYTTTLDTFSYNAPVHVCPTPAQQQPALTCLLVIRKAICFEYVIRPTQPSTLSGMRTGKRQWQCSLAGKVVWEGNRRSCMSVTCMWFRSSTA